MKKLVVLLLLVGFFTSCGPRRMKCGPGRRCLVDAPKEKKEKKFICVVTIDGWESLMGNHQSPEARRTVWSAAEKKSITNEINHYGCAIIGSNWCSCTRKSYSKSGNLKDQHNR